MQNIWDNDEEEKKRRQMMGAPLEGIQYANQSGNPPPQNIQENKNKDTLGTMLTGTLVNRAVNKTLDTATNKVKEGIDYLRQPQQGAYAQQDQYLKDLPKEGGTEQQRMLAEQTKEFSSPLSDSTTTNPANYSAAPPTAPTAPLADSNAAGPDVYSGLSGTENIATNLTADATTQATEAGATKVAEEGASKVAEGAVEGAAESFAGPLSGAITLAKTGDAGKAAGATAGTYIGGALGSTFGPIGTFVGSAIGSYVGQMAGDYLT